MDVKKFEEYFSERGIIANISPYSHLVEKLKDKRFVIPSFKIDFYLSDESYIESYQYVNQLPEKGKKGLFYILPDKSLVAYIDNEWKLIGTGGGGAIVDSEFSITSTNPLQNKTITLKINDLENNKSNKLIAGNNILLEEVDNKIKISSNSTIDIENISNEEIDLVLN